MSDTYQLDPAPEEWLSAARIDNLLAELGDAVSLMSQAGVLPDVLNYWIRRELGETEGNPSGSISWARCQWGHRLDSLFLMRKDWLDQASCRLLRVNQQGLALELYHRLLNEEATFVQLSQQFGVGPERFHGGLYKLQTLNNLPGGLGQLLRKLEPGELTKPMRIGEQFGLIQLTDFVPATHGEASSLKLLELELQRWVDGMSSHLETLVKLKT
jgi:parvulin-like peptidyl-prolyl isomerase